MKPSQCILSVEGVEWGSADFVYFKKLARDREQLRLEGFTLTNAITPGDAAEVTLDIFIRGRAYWDYIFIPVDWEIDEGQRELRLYRDDPSWRFYIGGVAIHMLNRMVKGEEIAWRKLTRKGKMGYLKACVSWTGLPARPIGRKNYTIDGAQVKIEADFYCLLGEVFFGEKGYFGQDLHGFNDCFSEIYLHGPDRPLVEPGATVTILNKARLERVLNREFAGYFTMFVEDLKKYGFTVKWGN